MTQEELKEYNKLSQIGRDTYNTGMRANPEWTHEQAMTYVSIVLTAIGEPIPLPGRDEDEVNIKDLYLRVIVKAQKFIETDFPRIYQQVKGLFKEAIDWLANAVNVTLNKIIDFFK